MTRQRSSTRFAFMCIFAGFVFAAQGAEPRPIAQSTSTAATPVRERSTARSDAFPLVFEEKHHDAGAHFESDRHAMHEFRFTNTSDRVVKLGLRGPCGITFTLGRTTVAPGESSVVHAFLTLQNRRGPINKTVTVYEIDNPSSNVQLRYSAMVIPNVLFDPPPQVHTVEEGAGVILSWTVTGLGEDFAIVGTDTLPPHVQLEFSESTPTIVQGRPARRMKMTLRLDSAAPRYAVFSGCTLKLSGGETPEFFFPAKIYSVPPITAPSQVRLNANADDPSLANAAFTLRARDNMPFMPTLIEVQASAGASPSVEWEPSLEAGQFVIRVRLAAAEIDPASSLSGTLLLHAPLLREPLAIPYRLMTSKVIRSSR